MNLGRTISGVIWAVILAIALQLVPSPASAHPGHAHHAGDVSALAHHQHTAGTVHQRGSADQKAATRTTQPSSHTSIASSLPDRSEVTASAGACTGGCCGAGAGCCGAALVGSTADLPDITIAVMGAAYVDDRRSGIDPDGLARPPRTLAL
jgi:hypothetical protein